MSLKTDKVQLEIVIKGDKTRAEIAKLEAQSKELSKALKKLPQDSDEFIKKSAELKQVQNRMDQLRNEIGLTGMTMRELRNRSRELNLALNNMDPRTPRYKELRAELDKVNLRMRELKGNSQAAGFSFKKMADGFNRYMGIFAAISASIIGVVFSMRKMIDAFDEYQQKVANLGAITGLAGDDLEWLSNKAKEMSTSVTESGVRITKSADDIIDAYTKVGSKRPELLQNKEALAEVTEQALILAEAGQMDLNTAIEAVTASLNQFNLETDQSGRIINTLAAGSLEGSAGIASLTASMKNAGTVSDDSNLSLEQTVAWLEVLASKQIENEEAGTKFRGAMLKLKQAGVGYASGQFDVRDALIEVNQQLSSVGSAMERDALIQKTFGQENVTVGTIMLKNIDTFDTLTTKITDTSVATEQAIKNTSTHKAELEQAKNRAHLMAIELGERLAPIMTFSTNAATMFLKGLMKLPSIIRENRVLIIALGTALLAYKAKQIEATLTKAASWVKWRAMLIQERIETTKTTYAKKLAEIQDQKLFKGARILQKGFQKLYAVIKMNPWGAVIVAVGAIITAFVALSNSFTSITASQKAFNEANKKAAEIASEETSQLRLLVFQIKNTKQGTDERKAAIDKLNQSYGQYMPNLLNENSTYKELIASLIEINNQIQQKAKLQAYEEALTQAYKDQLSVKQELDDANKREAEGTWVGNTLHNRKMSIMALNAEYEQYNQVIQDLTREVSVLQYTQEKSNATTTDSSARMSELMTIINDVTKSDQERNDAIMEYNSLAKAAGLETLELINTTVNLNNELEKTTSAYQELTSEISKYESLLKDAVVKGNQAEIDSITRKLVDLNKEKDLYDGIIESLQEMIAIQSSVPEQLAMIDPLADANNIQGTLEKRTTYTDEYNSKNDPEALKVEEDLQKQRVALLQNAETQMWSFAQSMTDSIFEYKRNKMNAYYDAEQVRLEDRYNRGEISEADYQKKVLALNKKKHLEEVRMARKEAMFKRGIQSSQISIEGIKDVAKIKMTAALLAADPLTLPYVPAALLQIPVVAGIAALEIGAIMAAPLPQYARGKYPAKGTSGQYFNTDFVGLPKTGVYSSPSLGIFSEYNPEMVIDHPTLKTLERRNPEVLNLIYRTAGQIPQYAEGKYPENTTSSTGKNDMILIQQNKVIIDLLSSMNLQLQNSYNFKDLDDRLEDVRSNKDFISKNFAG